MNTIYLNLYENQTCKLITSYIDILKYFIFSNKCKNIEQIIK